MAKVLVIPGFPDYLITRAGKVWSDKGKGRWLKIGVDSGGYPMVILYENGRTCNRRIHRLVLETFIGPCPNGMEACHNNGNKADHHLRNLRWDFLRNNTLDAIKHGTHVNNRGEKCGAAKLIKLLVARVRQRCY